MWNNKDSANDAPFTLLLKLTFNENVPMKKKLLALATTLLLPNMSFAAACADGANAAGCTIDTSAITYTLTGDIAPASTVTGIQFNTDADDNTINLTGDISTTGLVGHALYFFRADDNTLNLTGDISTTGGDSAMGLFFFQGNSNTINHIGNISTTANTGHGLYFLTSNLNETTLTGNISTTAIGAHGVYLISTSNDNVITITGNISTTGNSSHGLLFDNDSDSNTVNLTGSLSATGAGSYAIYANSTSDNNTVNLTLNQGDRLIGDIVNDGSGNTLNLTLNDYGRASSYSYTSSGSTELDWNVTDNSPRPFIIGSAKSRGVADMDDAGNRLYQRLSQINSSLTNQQRQTRQGYARGDYWIDSYYTDSERDTVLQEVNQNTRGITVGFNASGDRDLAMDVIINYENSDAGYGLSEQTVDSNSLMVGLSFPELMTAMDGSLAVKFLAGMSDNDRDLTVLNNTVSTGQETITDSYDSTYVTAGASWMQSLYATQRFHHNVLVGMDINHERIEGTTASSYYALADRDITQLVGQAQYGVTYTGINEKLTINGSIGLAHANIIDGEKQHYTIDGTAVSYTADNSNTYTTASLGATYQLNPQAYAYAHVKQFDSTDDIDGTTGKVGLVVNF